jgi:hypothetical protein
MKLTSSQPSYPPEAASGVRAAQSTSDPSARINQIPREVGLLLLAAGVVTGMMPPPPGPFDVSLMLAGGVTLWPRGLRTIESWTRTRFPRAHCAGMSFLVRYLDDLEQRYPGSTVHEKYTAKQVASTLAPEATDEATRPV